MPEIFAQIFTSYRKAIKILFKGRNLPLYGMMKYHMGWMDENGGKY